MGELTLYKQNYFLKAALVKSKILLVQYKTNALYANFLLVIVARGHQKNATKTPWRSPLVPAVLITTSVLPLLLTARPGTTPSTRLSPPLRRGKGGSENHQTAPKYAKNHKPHWILPISYIHFKLLCNVKPQYRKLKWKMLHTYTKKCRQTLSWQTLTSPSLRTPIGLTWRRNATRGRVQWEASAATPDQTFNWSCCGQTCLSCIGRVSHQCTCTWCGQLLS